MSLRLISDTSSETCAGRLEVFYSGAWGSVGKSDMSATTVGVVCRQLGCADKGSIRPAPSDKVEKRHMWVDNVQCPKGPETLWQCPSSPWKWRLASPSEETWITCAGEYPWACMTISFCCSTLISWSNSARMSKVWLTLILPGWCKWFYLIWPLDTQDQWLFSQRRSYSDGLLKSFIQLCFLCEQIRIREYIIQYLTIELLHFSFK